MNMIEIIDLEKRFGDFVAVDKLNMKVEKGEIKAIVGENGAGKTTLMNMLFGMEQPTSGEILINGKKVHFRSPREAINMGIGMVHQHFKLVPSLTIYENIILGREIKCKIKGKITVPIINTKNEKDKIQELIDQYDFKMKADDRICDLSVGERQRVEILKMLYRDASILILDEPTAVLTPQEVDELLDNLKALQSKGKTILLITHKLQEVMSVSNSVTVIRKGKLVGNVNTTDTNRQELARMMVGRDVVLTVQNNNTNISDEVVYSVKNLVTTNKNGKNVLNNISFNLHKGEILGIAGVEGNGQSELGRVLSGMMCVKEGSITINGEDITNQWPKCIRQHRIGIIPEDRYAQGLCRELTIADNCICGYFERNDVCKHGFLKKKNINQKREKMIEDYSIRVSDANGCVSELSGGNAQKIIIAREMMSDPDVIIASQPTRGVDIGSIEYIHTKLIEAAASGKAVLLISSELSEVMSLSNRILVMYKGEFIGEVERSEYTKEGIGLMMAGIQPEE